MARFWLSRLSRYLIFENRRRCEIEDAGAWPNVHLANEGGTGVGTVLICGGLLHVIDDEIFAWTFGRFKLAQAVAAKR